MIQKFGDLLRQIRAERNLSQDELAQLLGTSKQVISRYETNQRSPKITVVERYALRLGLPLSALLGEADTHEPIISLEPHEQWSTPLIGAYTLAEIPTQQNVCKLLDIDHVVPHSNVTPLRTKPRASSMRMVDMIVYDDSAAAGLPLYAEDGFEHQLFPEDEIPHGANFGVRISGDSMEPTIQDGSIVWVHKQSSIDEGEVGIFMLADSAVCKRARLNKRGRLIRLDSDNPAYEPITNSDLVDVRCVGRVLS